MKRNGMKHVQATHKVSEPVAQMQALNDLRLRILTAKGGFLKLGTPNYMAFVEAQATREGKVFTTEEKVKIRQVFNANLSTTDLPLVELVERALQFQQAA
jgi:hypothetical protein